MSARSNSASVGRNFFGLLLTAIDILFHDEIEHDQGHYSGAAALAVSDFCTPAGKGFLGVAVGRRAVMPSPRSVSLTRLFHLPARNTNRASTARHPSRSPARSGSAATAAA